MLVISGCSPRESWPLGIIEEGEASSAGLVRTVVMCTQEGSVRRDIRNVALIEGSE